MVHLSSLIWQFLCIMMNDLLPFYIKIKWNVDNTMQLVNYKISSVLEPSVKEEVDRINGRLEVITKAVLHVECA